jgi:hypothetical protein
MLFYYSLRKGESKVEESEKEMWSQVKAELMSDEEVQEDGFNV